MAGSIPEIKIISTTMDNPAPIIIFQKLKTNSKSNKLVKSIDNNQTKVKPIAPPITQRIMASNKNWKQDKSVFCA